MKVLTVYAHPDPHSFCHGVLERFTAGLQDAGHDSEVVDLYGIDFDPVLRPRDQPSWINDTMPEDVAERHDIRGNVLRSARNPVQRWLVRRAIRGKSHSEVAGMLRSRMPKDVLAMHEKIRWADGLAFVAPIYFCSFPAILKGWIDRVWCYDFAFGLTPEGWHGDVNGRVPLLQHQRALLMTSTIFDEAAYDDGLRDAIAKVVDEWGFRYPGIPDVEHVYFYAATSAAPERIAAYLDRTHRLGREFDGATSLTA